MPKRAMNKPDSTSSDYDFMLPYWQKVWDLSHGTEAMRLAGQKYLPKFEKESTSSYEQRRVNAVYTDIYGDIVENLADRPFSKEVQLITGSSKMKQYVEDIDGQGNNLHNFAATFFKNAINYSIDWIFVDYTNIDPSVKDASGQPRRRSVAEERASGARPYWVRVSAQEMIAVYSIVINGIEQFVHCRMVERWTERVGFDEVETVQIRELNRELVFNDLGVIIGLEPATYKLWQQRDQSVAPGEGLKPIVKKDVWTIVEEGPMSIGIIPIVPLIIGERDGNSWRINAAMKRCVDLQIDYYEEENGLKNIKKLTAYPMLSANGVEPEKDDSGKIIDAPVGPRAVLYAPPTGDGNNTGRWEIIEPAATSLTFLRNELKEKAKELRELGRQPLTQSSGQLTTSTSDQAASKGEAAIKRWALALKDALELAAKYIAMWDHDMEPTLYVDTNFELDEAKDDGFESLLQMRESGDLSQETLWAEAKRRRILSDEFDPAKETTALEKEMPDEGDLTDAGNVETTSPAPEDDVTS